MSRENVPNSTERLLNRIRDNKSQTPPSSLPVANRPETNRPETNRIEQSVFRRKILKKSLTAGVLIGHRHLSLSLTGECKANKKKELIKWQCVLLPEALNLENKRFSAFLRSALDTFLTGYKTSDIWTSIDTKDLKHKNIVVPDLPDSKMANAALWGLKKEYEVIEDQDVFNFEIISDVMVDGIKKRNISAFTGNREKIEQLKKVFSKAGFPLKGITALPFALHNFFIEQVSHSSASPFVLVNVARHHSDISCYSDSGLLLVRNIRSGAFSIAEDFDEEPVEESQIADILTMNQGMDSPEFENMRAAAERLVAKIVRTGDYCSNNVADNKPIEQYFIYGEADNCQAFMEFAKANIPSRVDLFMPLETMTEHHINMNVPVNAEERNMVIPATALALSSNQITPNFLYTFADKINETRIKKINMAVLAVGIVLLLVSFSGLYFMGRTLDQLHHNQKSLTHQISQYQPQASRESVSRQVSNIQKKIRQISQYTKDYESLAVINEVISLTPSNIYIESFDADFDGAQSAVKNSSSQIQLKPSATISGMIRADHTALEPTLTGYIIRLEDSKLFKNVMVENKEIQDKAHPDVLTFSLGMEIDQWQ